MCAKIQPIMLISNEFFVVTNTAFGVNDYTKYLTFLWISFKICIYRGRHALYIAKSCQIWRTNSGGWKACRKYMSFCMFLADKQKLHLNLLCKWKNPHKIHMLEFFLPFDVMFFTLKTYTQISYQKYRH